MKYSQNNEQEFIVNYFSGRIGTFLDIGAYDGVTFSNTYSLLQDGWNGVYLEPAKGTFQSLSDNLEMYVKKGNAILFNQGLALHTGKSEFFDSGGDAVSTTSVQHAMKWQRAVRFTKTEVDVISTTDLLKYFDGVVFNMVSLDTEGTNVELLYTLPLDVMGTELIVVEHDSQYNKVIDYCSRFGLKEIHRNGENLILAK